MPIARVVSIVHPWKTRGKGRCWPPGKKKYACQVYGWRVPTESLLRIHGSQCKGGSFEYLLSPKNAKPSYDNTNFCLFPPDPLCSNSEWSEAMTRISGKKGQKERER